LILPYPLEACKKKKNTEVCTLGWPFVEKKASFTRKKGKGCAIVGSLPRLQRIEGEKKKIFTSSGGGGGIRLQGRLLEGKGKELSLGKTNPPKPLLKSEKRGGEREENTRGKGGGLLPKSSTVTMLRPEERKKKKKGGGEPEQDPATQKEKGRAPPARCKRAAQALQGKKRKGGNTSGKGRGKKGSAISRAHTSALF